VAKKRTAGERGEPVRGSAAANAVDVMSRRIRNIVMRARAEGTLGRGSYWLVADPADDREWAKRRYVG